MDFIVKSGKLSQFIPAASFMAQSSSLCTYYLGFFVRHIFVELLPHLYKSTGPGCSKLTTSLVNVSLKFQKSKTKICQYFLLKKM